MKEREYTALPQDEMRIMRIAFDVDGTLRCNCTDTCERSNLDIVVLFRLLAAFKNTELYVWSGQGKEHAERFSELFELPIARTRCISKFDAPKMDIAVDDIHATNLADKNLIVRCK
ncbi:MAG: hypothetical protein WA991_03805 [Ornithinimicrobium sp.]